MDQNGNNNQIEQVTKTNNFENVCNNKHININQAGCFKIRFKTSGLIDINVFIIFSRKSSK